MKLKQIDQCAPINVNLAGGGGGGGWGEIWDHSNAVTKSVAVKSSKQILSISRKFLSLSSHLIEIEFHHKVRVFYGSLIRPVSTC